MTFFTKNHEAKVVGRLSKSICKRLILICKCPKQAKYTLICLFRRRNPAVSSVDDAAGLRMFYTIRYRCSVTLMIPITTSLESVSRTRCERDFFAFKGISSNTAAPPSTSRETLV